MHFNRSQDEISPIQATELDLFRYIKRPEISDLDFAFLMHGYLPKSEIELAFSSNEYIDIKEMLKFLRSYNEKCRLPEITEKKGVYFSSFKRWFIFLETIGHPVPDDIKNFLVELEKTCPVEVEDDDKVELSEEKLNDDAIMNLLKAKIEMLALIFQDIPYRHYLKFPQVQSLVSSLNLSEERYVRIVGGFCQYPKKIGRPSKGLIDKYLDVHKSKELQIWLSEIKKEMD